MNPSKYFETHEVFYVFSLMTTKDALNADTSEKFDESWPTSEKPSTIR